MLIRLSLKALLHRLHGCRLTRMLCAGVALAGAGLAPAAAPSVDPAVSLQARYVALGEQLRNNQFQRALTLDSAESARALKGDIYALVDYRFADVKEALADPAHWCDVLNLHINTKYCRAATSDAGTTLAVRIGNKHDQPLDQAYRIDFAYRAAATRQDYLELRLDAETGPLGTSDYRILVEAIPVAAGKTFLHVTYSYAYDRTGRLAMQAYLGTVGRGKRGFTVVGRQSDGRPDYIRGVRGVVERNTMRYYLAIDAYLGALAAPSAERAEKRLHSWFDSVERYPEQLHEVDRATYLEMKRSERRRQQLEQPPEQ